MYGAFFATEPLTWVKVSFTSTQSAAPRGPQLASVVRVRVRSARPSPSASAGAPGRRPTGAARRAAAAAATVPAARAGPGAMVTSERKTDRMSQMASLSPRRLALKYSPPTVILEYSGGDGFLHYKVHLRNLERGMVRPRRRPRPPPSPPPEPDAP